MKSFKKTKRFAALAATAAIMLVGAPVFAATSMSVSNNNQATVSNSVSLSANSGGNASISSAVIGDRSMTPVVPENQRSRQDQFQGA